MQQIVENTDTTIDATGTPDLASLVALVQACGLPIAGTGEHLETSLLMVVTLKGDRPQKGIVLRRLMT